jgi:hypothetical protein
MKLGGQIKMGKKLLSMFMIVLILLTMMEPLSSDSVMAVSESHPQESKTTNVALNAKATASGQCSEYEKPSLPWMAEPIRSGVTIPVLLRNG